MKLSSAIPYRGSRFIIEGSVKKILANSMKQGKIFYMLKGLTQNTPQSMLNSESYIISKMFLIRRLTSMKRQSSSIPQMVQAYYNLGSLALTKGDLRKGLKYYQKCNEVNPKFPQAYMMQGLVKFLARKKDTESIALFDKAVSADSAYALTYLWRGLAYISLEKPNECLKNWNALIRREPDNSLYTLLRGFLYIELGDFDNAFNDLRKAMRLRAVDDERFTAGQTVLDKRIDLQYAANYLITNGYGLDEKSFGFLKKGFCLLLAGKHKEAIDEIRKSERIQPSATVYFIEALAYEHFGDHYTALTYYNKALALDNDIFDAHKKRSVYRTELKDWKGAHQDFDDMLRLQPQSPAVFRLRGLSRSVEGDYNGAIEDLTKFMKTDSTDYEVHPYAFGLLDDA